MRDFTGGMHVNPTRSAIAEQDLWWCENLQPLASGNLVPIGVSGASAANNNGEGSLPYYVTEVSIGGVANLFVAYNSGNAYLINLGSQAWTKIMTNLLNIVGQTYVVNWTGNNFTNSGILIIDPNGYWDYNLTAANTLTSLSNTVTVITNTFKTTVAGGTALKFVTTAGGGTGGLFQAHYQVTSAVPLAAGAGYVPGDILSLTDNNPVTPCQLLVTTTGGGGSVTGISVTIPGDYPGPTAGLVATGPSGTVVAGGSGAGATFTIKIQSFKMVILTPGHGFATPTTVADETAANVHIDDWNFTIGVSSGTAIATYAGRVWIGNGNTLVYSDINSYNDFAGAGGSSTFSDTYLIGGITCLYATNNYLYMFGAVSVDVVSNVQVNATTGLTNFSRVNVLQGIGVTYINVMTVIGYNRGIVFLDITGYYLLAGATPERISERIQAVLRASDLLGFHVRPSSALANINSELCLLLQLAVIPDSFSQAASNRSIIFIYQRHRWWCLSNTFGNNLAQGPISGTPNFTGSFGAWTVVTTSFGNWAALSLPHGQSAPGPWQLRTKLWDGGASFREKQVLNVSMQAVWTTPGPITATGVAFTVDSELQTSSSIPIPNIPTLFVGAPRSTGINNGLYALQVVKSVMAQAQAWGSQFIGLTFIGDGTQVNVIEGLAMRGKQENNKLE
jgi:hypothetical protein